LLQPTLCDYAGELLLLFVRHATKLYGQEFLVYNVHNLVHLHEDSRLLGNLDSYSAFKFENCLNIIKRFLRSPHKPLQQLVRRVGERGQFNKRTSESNREVLKMEH